MSYFVPEFGKYEVLTEIVIREKQYDIGVQPIALFLFSCYRVTFHNASYWADF